MRSDAQNDFVDLELEPNPRSVVLMDWIDRQRKPIRDLVREFGFVIVYEMIDEGYNDAEELRGLLEVWRERRQEQWMATDFFRQHRRK